MSAADDDYDPQDDFRANGRVRCEDCGARVRTETLESLPPHRCTERARENVAGQELGNKPPKPAVVWAEADGTLYTREGARWSPTP